MKISHIVVRFKSSSFFTPENLCINLFLIFSCNGKNLLNLKLSHIISHHVYLCRTHTQLHSFNELSYSSYTPALSRNFATRCVFIDIYLLSYLFDCELEHFFNAIEEFNKVIHWLMCVEFFFSSFQIKISCTIISFTYYLCFYISNIFHQNNKKNDRFEKPIW